MVPAVRERGTAAPLFSPMSIVATVAHLSYTAELLLGVSSAIDDVVPLAEVARPALVLWGGFSRGVLL